MRTLTDFLKGLPGIKPRIAREAVLEGGVLTEAERADIHEGDGFWGTLEVGPDAAAAILAAYRAGRLPMQPRRHPAEAPEAEAYLARREALLAEIAERDRKRRAPKDLSLVRESDFRDERFLDAVFHAQLGPGGGTLTLAGIAVTKTLAGYPSNSGKTMGWAVGFDWVGSDGERRSSGTGLPAEARNRRNDAERNWGLGPG